MYEITGRVGASQTDTNSRMKLISAMDVIQDCSQFWTESEPGFMNFLCENNLGMFLLSRQADIRRLPVYGEHIRTVTSIFECKGFYGYRNTVLYGEDDRPCILTWSIGAFIHFETGRPMRLPQEELDKVLIEEKVEMPYLDRKIKLPESSETVLPPVHVRRNDIDMNHHMNNARYLEAAFEFLPDDFIVRRFRVEYQLSAKPGDLLYPVIYSRHNGKLFISLRNQAQKPYANIEFTHA